MNEQLAAFQAMAASGQEMSHESLWPAEILLDGSAEALVCSGGSLKNTDIQFVPGGFLADFDLSFRVRKSLLAALPEVGARLQWRRPGETPYRGTARIVQASDPAGSETYMLRCASVEK